jgi:hypothetical protein
LRVVFVKLVPKINGHLDILSIVPSFFDSTTDIKASHPSDLAACLSYARRSNPAVSTAA